jgi:hypothetical protein
MIIKVIAIIISIPAEPYKIKSSIMIPPQEPNDMPTNANILAIIIKVNIVPIKPTLNAFLTIGYFPSLRSFII